MTNYCLLVSNHSLKPYLSVCAMDTYLYIDTICWLLFGNVHPKLAKHSACYLPGGALVDAPNMNLSAWHKLMINSCHQY